jgi:hypothetical protein
MPFRSPETYTAPLHGTDARLRSWSSLQQCVQINSLLIPRLWRRWNKPDQSLCDTGVSSNKQDIFVDESWLNPLNVFDGFSVGLFIIHIEFSSACVLLTKWKMLPRLISLLKNTFLPQARKHLYDVKTKRVTKQEKVTKHHGLGEAKQLRRLCSNAL